MVQIRAAIFAAALAFPALASAQDQRAAATEEPSRAPKIAAIRVEGNRRVEKDAILSALKSRVGQPFDPLKAQEDLKVVWGLGYFSDVQISVDETNPNAPALLVNVVEKPAVREVKIRGNKELSDEDLKDIVDLKPFSILDLAAVQRNVRKLQDKYVEKGYYLAEVTSVIEPVENNEVNIFLDANEHAKVQIKRITFVGNEKVPDSDLRDVMQTGEGGFLSFITNSGTFREEVFQHDLSSIQGVYYDRGFIHVKVGQPQIALSGDKKLIYISVPITEGEQFTVGKIGFSGDILTSRSELQEKMTVTPGELFNRSKLQRDIMSLADVYYDAGYAYANVSPLTEVDAQKRIVDLTFDIQKGQQVRIERIEITGNHKTRDKVIRRELRVFEGDLFNGTGLRLSRQRVTALGFFETVDLTHKRGSSDDTVVVTVNVKERATGTFQVGVGFSSVENFLLQAQVSQNNLFGWGPTASLSLQYSSLRFLAQFSYIDPYFLDSQWILSFDYFRQDLDYFGFIRRSNGGDVSLGYHLTPDLMLHLGYAIEQVAVESTELSSRAGLSNFFRNGLTSSLRLTLNYDARDNRLFPTAGNYQSLAVEHSPSWLGASFVFTRYSANTRWYYPLGAGLVLKGQGTFGYIAGDNVPISELYFIGGINTVRGYSLRSISPTIRVGSGNAPDTTLFEFGVGGNRQLIFNVELEFPLFEKAGLRGVVFYDAGNVWAQNQRLFESNFPGLHLPLGMFQSIGIGFRWFVPMLGPMRFEWGIPLNRRPTDESYQFQFTIGNFF